MTPEQFKEVKRIFLEASTRAPETRVRFLDEASAAAPSLRPQIEAMLAAHDRGESFMESPVAVVVGHVEAQPVPRPERIDGFRILDVLGQGGMGIVYLAEQDQPKRTVALKVIRPGVATQSTLRRFQLEADVLARLRHPGIAQIYQAGTAEAGFGPQPYFAMEPVEGVPLLRYAEENKLELRDRLGLLSKICEAVHHAHQKGVIHRDLKPANILVEGSGQPKILDFGVARVTDTDLQATTLHTDTKHLVGTIPYMSPEQIAGYANELDIRSDVYTLGVICYELLAGRPPYDVSGKTPLEACRIIRDEEPTRPGTISKLLRGDLETILTRALEKDKTRRYQHAADLAADFERYLRNEPIAARPPSATYRLSKFVRRRAVSLLVTTAIVLALVAGVGISRVLYPSPGTADNSFDRDAVLPAEQNTEAMTTHTLSEIVHKGVPAATVLESLGSPDIISTGTDGCEIWIYDDGIVDPLSGNPISETIIVKFDDNRFVRDVNYHLANTTGTLRLRKLQTRLFQTADQGAMLQAVISALHDLGYVVDATHEAMGIISATKSHQLELRINVHVKAWTESKDTTVRAVFQLKGHVVDEPEVYEQFFDALSQARFLMTYDID